MTFRSKIEKSHRRGNAVAADADAVGFQHAVVLLHRAEDDDLGAGLSIRTCHPKRRRRSGFPAAPRLSFRRPCNEPECSGRRCPRRSGRRSHWSWCCPREGPRAGNLRPRRVGLRGKYEPRAPSELPSASGIAETPIYDPGLMSAIVDLATPITVTSLVTRTFMSVPSRDLTVSTAPSTLSMVPRMRTVGGCWAHAAELNTVTSASEASARGTNEDSFGMIFPSRISVERPIQG